MALYYSFAQSHPFGTRADGIAGVLDVGTLDDGGVVVGGEEGGADAEVGIGTWEFVCSCQLAVPFGRRLMRRGDEGRKVAR